MISLSDLGSTYVCRPLRYQNDDLDEIAYRNEFWDGQIPRTNKIVKLPEQPTEFDAITSSLKRNRQKNRSWENVDASFDSRCSEAHSSDISINSNTASLSAASANSSNSIKIEWSPIDFDQNKIVTAPTLTQQNKKPIIENELFDDRK